jgi:hypothetical protein
MRGRNRKRHTQREEIETHKRAKTARDIHIGDEKIIDG